MQPFVFENINFANMPNKLKTSGKSKMSPSEKLVADKEEKVELKKTGA
jgi:hypothetical protein